MKKSIVLKVVISGAVLVSLGACQTAQPALTGQLDRELGSAVKHNIEAQFVRPTAVQKANTYIPADPTRAALARKRYQEDKVKEPKMSKPTVTGG